MSKDTENAETFEKELIGDKVTKSILDTQGEMVDDADIGEVTFGRGATKKTLLCTSGVSLKKLVEMSK